MAPICRHAVVMAALLSVVEASAAFELTPIPTRTERMAAKKSAGIVFRTLFPVVNFGVHTFSNSVHEAITNLAYDCPGSGLLDCKDPELDAAPVGVLAGLRWNDDPPFRFSQGQGRYSECDKDPTFTVSFALRTNCWYAHFKDIQTKADKDPALFLDGKGTMLARTHFGDLQFLHSMANAKGTPPEVTLQKVMMWAQFSWRVASHGPERIRPETRMGSVDLPGLQEHFPANEERTVSDLFTLGRPWLRPQLRDLAFGSLLHMVQDSFAGGHATRVPTESAGCSVPAIKEFHTYAGQDKDAHKHRDGFERAEAGLRAGGTTVVDVLKELIRRRDEDQSWAEVAPYLRDCVFRLTAHARAATTAVAD